jgi:hypothetical protein
MQNEEINQNKKILEQHLEKLKNSPQHQFNADIENMSAKISYLEYIIYAIMSTLNDTERFDYKAFIDKVEKNTNIVKLEDEFNDIKNRYFNRIQKLLFKEDVVNNLNNNDLNMIIDILKDNLKKEG